MVSGIYLNPVLPDFVVSGFSLSVSGHSEFLVFLNSWTFTGISLEWGHFPLCYSSIFPGVS